MTQTPEDRYEIVLDRATEVLGTKERGKMWLEKVSNTLCCPPMELLTTQEGFEQVMRHLHSVELALDTD